MARSACAKAWTASMMSVTTKVTSFARVTFPDAEKRLAQYTRADVCERRSLRTGIDAEYAGFEGLRDRPSLVASE